MVYRKWLRELIWREGLNATTQGLSKGRHRNLRALRRADATKEVGARAVWGVGREGVVLGHPQLNPDQAPR